MVVEKDEEVPKQLRGSYVDHTIRRIKPGQCPTCGRYSCRGHRVKMLTSPEVKRPYRQMYPDDPHQERFPSVHPHIAAQYKHRLQKRQAKSDEGVGEQLTRKLLTASQKMGAMNFKPKEPA